MSEEKERLEKVIRDNLGENIDFEVRPMTQEEVEAYRKEQKSEFDNLKSRGLLRGLLIGLFFAGLYFFPFTFGAEISAAEVEEQVGYIPIFWDVLKTAILIPIVYLGGGAILIGFNSINDNLEQLKMLKELTIQDKALIVRESTHIGIILVAIPTVIIVLIIEIVNLVVNLVK